MQAEQNSLTVVDYYVSGNGERTIRIDAKQDEILRNLVSVFRGFAANELQQFQLERSRLIVFTKHILSFDLRLVSKEPLKSVTVSHVGDDQVEIVWGNSVIGWDEAADLLQGGIDSPIPCHQYFSHRASDDAEIEISLRERTHLQIARTP